MLYESEYLDLSPDEAAALGDGLYHTNHEVLMRPAAQIPAALLLAQRPLLSLMKRLTRRALRPLRKRRAGQPRPRPLPSMKLPLDELLAAWLLLRHTSPPNSYVLFPAAWMKLDQKAQNLSNHVCLEAHL